VVELPTVAVFDVRFFAARASLTADYTLCGHAHHPRRRNVVRFHQQSLFRLVPRGPAAKRRAVRACPARSHVVLLRGQAQALAGDLEALAIQSIDFPRAVMREAEVGVRSRARPRLLDDAEDVSALLRLLGASPFLDRNIPLRYGRRSMIQLAHEVARARGRPRGRLPTRPGRSTRGSAAQPSRRRDARPRRVGAYRRRRGDSGYSLRVARAFAPRFEVCWRGMLSPALSSPVGASRSGRAR